MSRSPCPLVRRDPLDSRAVLGEVAGPSLGMVVAGAVVGLFVVGAPLDLAAGMESGPAILTGLGIGSASGPLYAVHALLRRFRQRPVGERGLALVTRANTCVDRAAHLLGGADLASDPLAHSALAALREQRSLLVESLAALHFDEHSRRVPHGLFFARWDALTGVVSQMEAASAALTDLSLERAHLSQAQDGTSIAERAALELARALEEATRDAQSASRGAREVRAALQSPRPLPSTFSAS